MQCLKLPPRLNPFLTGMVILETQSPWEEHYFAKLIFNKIDYGAT